jgi:hypothetical protein
VLRSGNVHRVLGHNVIRAYLGQGKPDHSHRRAAVLRGRSQKAGSAWT